ncbi:hypothetical protein IFM58399_03141 [Aspergillus lentulus]|uniref:Uncharacterized protein n=1 Tax=Aspergillus lentulus TaxID=293939 RepID=A0ABQ1AVI5_ASPLE|nr:uncharacterized protein IFM58399_03141 [Aspergillus lentulus]GFF32219.1 hypothetical protein IFM58399_03141 [Aspergillus lentulus]GFF88835.1 hypothetical protein IFM60648_08525 [Aspergillus lentulus]GFG03883.1 hypothetical protein IFM61392_03031 [Aspergillus lentulus]
MSSLQNQNTKSQAVKIESAQTGPAEREVSNGGKYNATPRGSNDIVGNDSHSNPNGLEQADAHDNCDADWEVVSSAQCGEKGSNQAFHGHTGHFSVDVGWGKRKHRLYSSDWSFGHHHHQHHDDRHGERGTQ